MNKYQALNKFIKTLKILYIVGCETSSKSTRLTLEKYFKYLDIAKSEKEGIEKFENYHQKNKKYYDIVIIDIDMSDLNSIDICTSILSQNDEQNILILSQGSDPLLKLKQAGVFNFITKPIDESCFETNILQVASILQKQTMIEKQSMEIKTLKKSLESAGKKANEASHQKSYFLANMSHEIRTPLNAIMGFINLLHEKETDAEKVKYLEVVKDASDSLLKVINDILDITKIESGKLEIDSIPFNPYEKLMHTTELFQAKAAQDGIIFKVKVNQSLPETLIGDPFRIQQIFSNLLSNAIKFTPKGSIVKALIWYADDTLHVRVKDYGIGIVKEKHAYIFEAFNQADNRMATEYGGTGLGLALCAELSKLVGGTLSLEDNKKGGSIFTLKIKMPIVKEVIKEFTKDKNISDRSILKGHLLVVEDIEANRMFIGIILSNMGLTFDTAVDGFDAIEKFKAGKYDLILMDENMPRLGGIDATNRILKLEKEQDLKHTPIVTLTANALKGDKERFLEAGMDDYLSKPVHPDEIDTVLRKFL